MALLFHPFLVALSCLLCAGHVLGQPSTLTVSAPNSTATPRQNGANALEILFNPPVLQVTGVVPLNVLACGLVPGLPTNVAIVDANLSSAPPVVTVTASARGGVIGALTLSSVSLRFSTPAFPLNQTDGSYSIAPTGGIAHVGRVNGTLTGKSFDIPGLDVTFQTQGQPQALISGSFRPLPPGLLQMSGTQGVQLPLSQIVDAAGFGNSTLVKNDIAGGSIQIFISILASGPDPCPSKRKFFF